MFSRSSNNSRSPNNSRPSFNPRDIRNSRDSQTSSTPQNAAAPRPQHSSRPAVAPGALNSFVSTSSDETALPKTFAEFNLHHDLNRAITGLGFEIPTPIQVQSIPVALQGRDLLACAMTGSGKTAAFLLPILNRLLESGLGTTRVLVLTPTRELAAQIAEHLGELARYTPVRGTAIFGGVAMGPQQTAFQRGVEIIIATPGRLLDHFQYPYAQLKDLEYLVLDEADRMLDMGFLPDIRRVLRHLPRTPRQTLFFSATMPAPIVELSREMLRDAVAINIERRAAPATGVAQSLYPVSEELKSHLFLEILKDPKVKNVLAFTRTKHRANRLADFLVRQGVPCDRIHGNRSQVQRTDALAGFKSGRYRVLVATDIAARGIDIEALSHVINFDVPHIVEDYIHRVGRTARADLVGDALTFVAPAEEDDLRQIERHLNKRLPRVQVQGFNYHERPNDRFEVPLGERIAAIRARKSEERSRARAKAEKKGANATAQAATQASAEARRQGQKVTPRHHTSQGSQASHGTYSSRATEHRGPAPSRQPTSENRQAPLPASHSREQTSSSSDIQPKRVPSRELSGDTPRNTPVSSAAPHQNRSSETNTRPPQPPRKPLQNRGLPRVF
ncbi:MAG: DEAD/DEAH box helicase [Candidatus Ozemobacteraceae bacterium]